MSQLANQAHALSVCIATHNGSRYLLDQLTSILQQLEQFDEVVVVDDASTDNTTQVIADLNDPRVRLIELTTNVGYVAAFERALNEARNDRLLLSDQDDLWLPGRVELMRAALDTNQVVAGNLTTLDGPASIPGPYRQTDWRLDPRDSTRRWRNTIAVLAGNRPYFGSAMGLHRDALRVILPFPGYLRESHDLWIALCGIRLGSIAHLDAAVTARRYHDSNQTPERPRALPALLRSRTLMLRLIGEARRRVRTLGTGR